MLEQDPISRILRLSLLAFTALILRGTNSSEDGTNGLEVGPHGIEVGIHGSDKRCYPPSRQLALVTTRDIEEDEELLFSYLGNPGEGAQVITCTCGAEKCQGNVFGPPKKK